MSINVMVRTARQLRVEWPHQRGEEDGGHVLVAFVILVDSGNPEEGAHELDQAEQLEPKDKVPGDCTESLSIDSQEPEQEVHGEQPCHDRQPYRIRAPASWMKRSLLAVSFLRFHIAFDMDV